MVRRKRLHGSYGNRPGAACLWLIICMAISGAISMGNGLAQQRQVSPTKNIGAISPAPPGRTTGATATAPPASRYLPYAEPVAIELPSIGLQSKLIAVGKTPEGSMEVPAKPHFDNAAWYKHSPAPGQYGASIIIGHVDSYASKSGTSVFFNLSKLQLGDRIAVQRADKVTATFIVRAVRDYGQGGLPPDIIYGPMTDSAELRLITCSGRFDTAKQRYEGTTVVFAALAPKPTVKTLSI